VLWWLFITSPLSILLQSAIPLGSEAIESDKLG